MISCREELIRRKPDTFQKSVQIAAEAELSEAGSLRLPPFCRGEAEVNKLRSGEECC